MRRHPTQILLVAGALLAATPAAAAPCKISWKRLQPGVHYAAVRPPCIPASREQTSDPRLHLVRVEPQQARLVPLLAQQHNKGKNLTAAQWARQHKLSVVINLGMYQQDHRTHVGYTRVGARVHSRAWVASYLSLLALHPRNLGLKAGLRDLPGDKQQLIKGYKTLVQNLRLIRSADNKRGHNVWSRATARRRWSEAALAQDNKDRLLLIFTRAPYSMWRFNELLLKLPLGIIRAQHLEGGPEASLSVHARGVSLDLCGSFETGFLPRDSNKKQWPLPNVLGLRRR